MREKKEENIEIGVRVRAARNNAGLTQEQLAEAIEVTTQYVSDLERGVVGISISTLRRLCLALEISADSILFGAGERTCVAGCENALREIKYARGTIETALQSAERAVLDVLR